MPKEWAVCSSSSLFFIEKKMGKETKQKHFYHQLKTTLNSVLNNKLMIWEKYDYIYLPAVQFAKNMLNI